MTDRITTLTPNNQGYLVSAPDNNAAVTTLTK